MCNGCHRAHSTVWIVVFQFVQTLPLELFEGITISHRLHTSCPWRFSPSLNNDDIVQPSTYRQFIILTLKALLSSNSSSTRAHPWGNQARHDATQCRKHKMCIIFPSGYSNNASCIRTGCIGWRKLFLWCSFIVRRFGSGQSMKLNAFIVHTIEAETWC